MNQNKNKLANQQNGSLDSLSVELSELEIESIIGGRITSLRPNIVESTQKDDCKCNWDPDSATLPACCWEGSSK